VVLDLFISLSMYTVTISETGPNSKILDSDDIQTFSIICE
jgi:hypothetical protein